MVYYGVQHSMGGVQSANRSVVLFILQIKGDF